MHNILNGGLALTALTALGLTPMGGGSQGTCSATTSAALAEGQTIVETAVGAGSFKTLVKALEAAELVGALQGPGPFTVFAPSDEAFAKLPAGKLASLLEPGNAELLKTILTYHVVAGDVRAAQVVGLESAAALNGQRIPVDAGQGGVRVAGVKVVKTDIACKNGVIHVVDAVMMPATKDLVVTAVDAGQFTTLARALGAAGLADALSTGGPFTVFAPNDAAFAKLPADTLASLLEPDNKELLVKLLKHHVVEGRVYADQLSTKSLATLGGTKLAIEVGEGGATIGGAGVLGADVEATNGVIHVIDRVLIPGA